MTDVAPAPVPPLGRAIDTPGIPPAIGLQSSLRFVPRYRPWMYLGAATLFTGVHTLSMAITWRWYY